MKWEEKSNMKTEHQSNSFLVTEKFKRTVRNLNQQNIVYVQSLEGKF